MLVAAEGRIVLLHYTMMDEQGAAISSTRGKEPLAFRLGSGRLPLGLEESLIGLAGKAGDKFRIFVPASRAYGPRTGGGARSVPRRELPREIALRPGVWVDLAGADGAPIRLWITKVQGSRVWLDTDHPLAGRNLVFDVELVEVLDPGDAELPDDLGPLWGGPRRTGT